MVRPISFIPIPSPLPSHLSPQPHVNVDFIYRWLERIQPWVHYVPIQVDLSDLYDIFAFFRGGMYGKGNHDEMARKMAEAGREWSRTYWRKEDMTAYLFR